MDRAPSDEQREERSVNPLLGGVLVWGVQIKRPGVQPYVFLILWFSLFNAYDLARGPIPDAGPATDGRAANHSFLNNSRQISHSARFTHLQPSHIQGMHLLDGGHRVRECSSHHYTSEQSLGVGGLYRSGSSR